MCFELVPDQSPEIMVLREGLLEVPPYGDIFIDVRRIVSSASDCDTSDTNILDRLAEANDCRRLGNAWVGLSRADAHNRLLGVLSTTLISPLELMPPMRAAEVADAFLALFEADSRYFSNGSFQYDLATHTWTPLEVLPSGVEIGPNWTPLTYAIMDTGIAIVSNARSGLLWVRDSD
jgi:hypothetical protein